MDSWKLWVPIVLVASTLAACGKKDTPDVPKPDDNVFRLPVIETTDLHGHIVNQVEQTVHYRLAYIADKVNDIRGRGDFYSKDRLLLLDGGDIYQGASISNMLEGKPVYVSMDRMGYDAVTVGNHEFDWDFEKLAEQDATMPDYEWDGRSCINEVPIVCANLYRDGARVPNTRDYVIIEKTATNSTGGGRKVRIGVIGFAIDYSSSIMSSKFSEKGYSVKEDYSIANDIARDLENNGQCDATILLIHGAADYAAGRLGPASSIDLVLGGHSHATLAGRSDSGIAYLQGGRYCENFARTEMIFAGDEDGRVSFTGVGTLETPAVEVGRDFHAFEGHNAEDIEEDIMAVADSALSEISEISKEVIGYITVDASTYGLKGSGGRACAMANWMCDIIRRIGDADVAFVNGGGVRTRYFLDGQPKRDITVSDVYEMFPFNNTTYVYAITYEELLRVFEYSMTSAGSSMFTGMTGLDCHFGNYSPLSLQKDGTVIYNKGKWTGDWASRTLTLAVSEYLATNLRKDSYTGIDNPLPEWNDTPRLLSSDRIDNENAVRVLKEEAASSGGHLFIDIAPHFIQDY